VRRTDHDREGRRQVSCDGEARFSPEQHQRTSARRDRGRRRLAESVGVNIATLTDAEYLDVEEVLLVKPLAAPK
jgi:hypothetical protein